MLTLMWWLGSIVRPVSYWHQHVVMLKSSWSGFKPLLAGQVRGSSSCQYHLSNRLQATKWWKSTLGQYMKWSFVIGWKWQRNWKNKQQNLKTLYFLIKWLCIWGWCPLPINPQRIITWSIVSAIIPMEHFCFSFKYFSCIKCNFTSFLFQCHQMHAEGCFQQSSSKWFHCDIWLWHVICHSAGVTPFKLQKHTLLNHCKMFDLHKHKEKNSKRRESCLQMTTNKFSKNPGLYFLQTSRKERQHS